MAEKNDDFNGFEVNEEQDSIWSNPYPRRPGESDEDLEDRINDEESMSDDRW